MENIREFHSAKRVKRQFGPHERVEDSSPLLLKANGRPSHPITDPSEQDYDGHPKLMPALLAHGLRERHELREEAEFALGSGDVLSVDALLPPLGRPKESNRLLRHLQTLSPTNERALDAPIQRTDSCRIERQMATTGARRDVSGWVASVHKNCEAGRLVLPLDRHAKPTSTSAFASFASSNEFESSVEALLAERQLAEAKLSTVEQMAMVGINEDEVKKRTAELRRMRDLTFHHERTRRRSTTPFLPFPRQPSPHSPPDWPLPSPIAAAPRPCACQSIARFRTPLDPCPREAHTQLKDQVQAVPQDPQKGSKPAGVLHQRRWSSAYAEAAASARRGACA